MKLKTGKEVVGIIPDLQEPFAHKDAFDFIKAVFKKYGVTKVVCIGDEVDFHAFAGKFPHDPDGYSPGHELGAAILALEKWYDEYPEVQVCTSNHLDRFYKRAYNAGLPRAAIRSPGDLLEAPKGWKWERVHTIDGVRYEHGDSQGGIDAARLLAITNRQSTVIGHHHAHGGVRFIANEESTIFGLNVGCLIDRHA